MNGKKLVLLLNENLPSGVMANTAAILGVSLGRRFPLIIARTKAAIVAPNEIKVLPRYSIKEDEV
ncbi:DUF2000 family protein [Dethiosulfovibrio sp. F2B]|uniref:DUF2000 family protein n=1 Tax=Dethiosulfovibrio faecalis TaxID=2720018 RepID=UPI001F2BD7C0|nr:DUF2000 family protein [Dethiosulfovibrio faecalis]MCF4152345.1 DUF2000 family protein [Dethiosulfovibrio faecalis]